MKTVFYSSQNVLKKYSVRLSFLILTLFLISQYSIAAVYTVDNRPESGAQYTEITEAVAAASAGDTIYVHPSSTKYNNVGIDKTLTIIGPGHDPANYGGINAFVDYIYMNAGSDNTVITGMQFAYLYAEATVNDVQIINNRITNNIRIYQYQSSQDNWIIEGNYFSYYYYSASIDARSATNLQIRNNVIEGQIRYLDHLDVITNNLFLNADPSGSAEIFTNVGGITSPIVSNNMFVFTDGGATSLTNSGVAVTYTNCLTWNPNGSDFPLLPGSGNLDNTDPLFTNAPIASLDSFYDNDYSLQSGSPAIGAATDGGEIGIYGRNFPFDKHGRPNSMPYPEVMTILNTVVQPGQDLNVEFQATQKN